MAEPLVAPIEQEDLDEAAVIDPDRAWVTVVWNDPVNLMTYVTWVFQKLFGYAKAEAERLMLQVHREGKSAVTSGNREHMELDVARLHAYGLWATVEQA
jgi:ATP-dependent Clp protease adaptor protein ClpS